MNNRGQALLRQLSGITGANVMAKYRAHLPQLGDKIFLTDGGLETCVIFHERIELPYFSSIVLLEQEQGLELLRRYFGRYIPIRV